MKIDKYDFPDHLYYSPQYLWLNVEGSTATIGASHFAALESAEIMYINVVIPNDMKIELGKPFGSLESGKGSAVLIAPISGIILNVNDEVEMKPNLINVDCYGKGWIVKVKPSDLKNELIKLFLPANPAFIEWQKDEIEKLRKKRQGVRP